MSKSKLRDLTMQFAVDVLKSTEKIKGHYAIINQLERSATSIGANTYEANYAQSRADFISKLQIALKECHETAYWLELLVKSEICCYETIKPLIDDCGTIRRILIASINTAKLNNKLK